MHLVTGVIIFIECLFLFNQLLHYLRWPQDRSRFWYLILLALLIFYNVTGGFFPDPEISWIPVIAQNVIAYGGGFLMGSYFPLFFYKGFGLQGLRRHALVYVPLFLLLPYVAAFFVLYPFSKDLDLAVYWGMPVPFVYSVVVLLVILNAIREVFTRQELSGVKVSKTEAWLLYAAVVPWALMSVFAMLKVTQWVEVLVTNLGFLVTTVVFIMRSVKREKLEKLQLEELKNTRVPSEAVFEANLLRFEFSAREIEVVRLARLGLTKEQIGEKLFIAPATVSSHMQKVYWKAGVNSRLELMRKLEIEELD